MRAADEDRADATVCHDHARPAHELSEPIEPGRTLHVSLILNDLHPMPPVQLEAAGRVVRVERLDGKSGVAIEFTSVRFENAETWTALRADEALADETR